MFRSRSDPQVFSNSEFYVGSVWYEPERDIKTVGPICAGIDIDADSI
jgi:hypothetical protein